jgi:serine/threonine protein kinase
MSAEPAATPPGPCPYCGEEHAESMLRCPTTDMTLPLAGRLLNGKYRFVSELGRGGMGTVWRARNIHVDREVALKLILPEVPKHPELVARFQNEARVAARIGHAGICDILDLELTPLGPVIVMELLRGENLAQRIAREGRLQVHVAVAIVREALVALEAAHRAGIIHRDLKPENIFLHQPDVGTTLVKLMDFGISKFIDRAGAQTASGVIMGTPEYMAPEQIGGAAGADARADVWAIGAVLYKALTGVDAFTGDSFAAILLAVASEPPAPLETLGRAVPRGLSAVIMRCLSKKPDDRFSSARELADALLPYAEPGASGEPQAIGSLPTLQIDALTRGGSPTVTPMPAPMPVPLPPERPSPWPRRLLALVLLAGAAAAGWWYLGREREGEQVATGEPPAKAEPPVADGTGADDTAADATGAAPEPAGASTTTGPKDPEPSDMTGGTGGTTGGSEPPKPPNKLIEAGDLVTPTAIAKAGDQHWAKEYCGALDKNNYLGIARWKLANPSEAKQFAKAAGLKAGGYWTSASHRGRGLVVWLPKGTDSSISVRKRVARPLCIAKKPE